MATVIEHIPDIKSLFESMVEKGATASYTRAMGLLAPLQDFDLEFLLYLFGSLLPQAASIIKILQENVLK